MHKELNIALMEGFFPCKNPPMVPGEQFALTLPTRGLHVFARNKFSYKYIKLRLN